MSTKNYFDNEALANRKLKTVKKIRQDLESMGYHTTYIMKCIMRGDKISAQGNEDYIVINNLADNSCGK